MDKKSIELFKELTSEQECITLAKELIMDSIRSMDTVFTNEWRNFTYEGFEFETSICLKEEHNPKVSVDMFSCVIFPIEYPTGKLCTSRDDYDDGSANICHEMYTELDMGFKIAMCGLGRTLREDDSTWTIEGYDTIGSNDMMEVIIRSYLHEHDEVSNAFIDLQIDDEFITLMMIENELSLQDKRMFLAERLGDFNMLSDDLIERAYKEVKDYL